MNVDLIYYAVDAFVIALFVRMYLASRKVIIEADPGNRFIVSGFLFLLGLFGIFAYDGLFRIIQTSVILFITVMLWMLKSGLAKEGAVAGGSMIPYSKTETITVLKRECKVQVTSKRGTTGLQFKDDQMSRVMELVKPYKPVIRP